MQLYGVEPDHFDNMLYFDALAEKKALARLMMEQKTKDSKSLHHDSDQYNKNYDIYTDSRKSIDYNDGLIQERRNLVK